MTTKFEELLEAHGRALFRGAEYRRDILGFAMALGNGFGTYLCGPPGTVGCCPVVGKDMQEVDSDRAYSVSDALEIDRDDSYWHFGLTINLNASESYMFHFAFFKRPGEYWIKIMPDGPEVTIGTPLQNDSFLPLFDTMHKEVMDHFNNGLSRFLERGGQPNKIEFQ
jgi:hypothetical protein